MARIDPPEKRNPMTRLVHGLAKRQCGGKLPEPFALMAHNPLLLQGYGGLEKAFEYTHKAPDHLVALVELKAAAICGCEWCMDFGSWLARERDGISDEKLREMPRFRDSDAFDADEKLVLEYAEGVSRTPVDVPDEVFARMRERFDEPEIVQLTWAAAIENMRSRFNWALGIESQDYTEGAACIRPEVLADAHTNGKATEDVAS
jgi:alkylhydroperoxidase family enzyme